MFKALLPVTLAAMLAPTLAWAEDVAAPESTPAADAASPADDTAAKEKRRGGGAKAAKKAPAPKAAPANNARGQRPGLRNGNQPAQADRTQRDAPDRTQRDAPDRTQRDAPDRDGGPDRADNDRARSAPMDARDGSVRDGADRAAPDRSAPDQRSASPASSDRRPPGHVRAAPANYRGPRAAAAHHAAVVHHRHVAAARHAAAVHHAAAAHAAWVSHRAPPRGWWYRPWRAGYPHYWYHGVFVYGPPPVYVGPGAPPAAAERAAEPPKRKVDHEGRFSLGIRGGSYLGGYHGGASYGDAGLGLAARYRIIEPLGLEVSWQYHSQTWESGTERIQQPIMTSMQLFAFPWSRVNPYFLAGVTVTPRSIDDNLSYATEQTDHTLWGPHAGLGLELNLTKDVSLNFDARYAGYVNKEQDDLSVPAAFQANLGANFYF